MKRECVKLDHRKRFNLDINRCDRCTSAREHSDGVARQEKDEDEERKRNTRFMSMLLNSLKACSSLRDSDLGTRIYDKTKSLSLSSDLFLSTAFVDMFSKSGNLLEARAVFDSMNSRDAVSWNALMQGYVLHGEDDQALELFTRMKDSDHSASSPDGRTYVAALKACAHKAEKHHGDPTNVSRCLRMGIEVHSEAAAGGFASDMFVASSLVDMYSKCACMRNARRVFNRLPCHDTVVFTSLLSGYVANGEPEEALLLFDEMKSKQLNARAFTAALMACASLGAREEGKRILGKVVKVKSLERGCGVHSEAVKSGFTSDLIVGNCLVEMYCKCGSMVEARKVFESMSSRSVVSWNSLIMGYSDNNEPEVALETFHRMELDQSCKPNARTFVAALTACTGLASGEFIGDETMTYKRVDGKLVNLSCLEKTMALHSAAVKKGFGLDMFVANTLIGLYGKCGSMEQAFRVFTRVEHPDTVSWTALITGYAGNGESEVALEIFSRMKDAKCRPNSRTYVAALTACAASASEEVFKQVDGRNVKVISLERGRSIHSEAASSSCVDVYVANALMTVYSKCGSMVEARAVFEGISSPDLVSWNALISGYAENGEAEMALSVFHRVSSPDCRTYVGALMAWSTLAEAERGTKVSPNGKAVKVISLEKGMAIHRQALRDGSYGDTFVGNCLIGMYCKCGSLLDARMVFDRMQTRSAVTWTCMINGYVENDETDLALQLFMSMGTCSTEPNPQTLMAASLACSCMAFKEVGKVLDGKLVKVESLERGRGIHDQALKHEFCLDGYVGNSLIGMYGKCGSMVDARAVFESMSRRDIVSWTALIVGYVENDEGETAMDVFELMKLEEKSCALDARALAAVLMACGKMVDMESGRMIHADVCRRGLESSDGVLVNHLVDFYGKCGSMELSQNMFDSLADFGDVVAWNALIAGYSHQGNAGRVFETLEKMVERGVRPNGVTFASVLKTCSHAGLVNKARRYFEEMVRNYGVGPELRHYSCLVDMLGRANLLDEAVNMVGSMPYEADAVTWTAVLGASYMWNDVTTGNVALKSLERLDQSDRSSNELQK